MKEQKIEFASGGRTFPGVFVEPDTQPQNPRPGVLVLHGGAGLGPHEHERASMLAGARIRCVRARLSSGEVFTSRELWHGRNHEPRRRPAEVARHPTRPMLCVVMRARPGVDPARVAGIGFCFGGLAALELARSGADLRAVVSFHGGLTARAPAAPGAVKAAVLVCTGAADPFVTREHRCAFEEEMTHAIVDWQLHVYANTMHAFTERRLGERSAQRPGSQYHEASDRRSWVTMRSLLGELFAEAR